MILFIFNEFFYDICLDEIQDIFWNVPNIPNKLQTSETSIISEWFFY